MGDAIELQGLGKRYRLGEDFAGYRYRTLRESLRLRRGRVRPEEIWALRDLNLEIGEGEVVGVVGRNGAGKTTLLKLLARITEPTVGVARMRGRVGALLEVGTGFHPELTGRENVYLSGSILGMPRREITRRFDEIVAFAELEGFLDTPLKRYSSGMSLRLAFAVAAYVQPPIVAIDEVLAVGDADFREKCLGKMDELGETGRTVVFVSHDLGAVGQLCSRTIWLEKGTVEMDGPTPEVLAAYVSSSLSERPRIDFTSGGSGPVELLRIELTDEEGNQLDTVARDRSFSIRVNYELLETLPWLDMAIYLTNSRGVVAMDVSHSDGGRPPLPSAPGEYEVSLTVPPVLASDDYRLGIWLGAGNDNYIHRDLFAFKLWPGPKDPTNQRPGVTQPPVRWQVSSNPTSGSRRANRAG